MSPSVPGSTRAPWQWCAHCTSQRDARQTGRLVRRCWQDDLQRIADRVLSYSGRKPCILVGGETRKVSAMADPEDPRLARFHDDLICEYYKIADLVTSFDQRLLTIKGWGVTLSLASIGLGFQQSHYGLFLVAALGGLSFWIVEATTKFHQLRYYPRMGDIEVACYDLFRVDSDHGPATSPLIDWGWYTAKRRVRGGPKKGESHIPQPWPEDNPLSAGRRVRFSTMLYPHVMFPHVIAMIAGTVLFVIGLAGYFGSI
jgi:hypothetical protein